MTEEKKESPVKAKTELELMMAIKESEERTAKLYAHIQEQQYVALKELQAQITASNKQLAELIQRGMEEGRETRRANASAQEEMNARLQQVQRRNVGPSEAPGANTTAENETITGLKQLRKLELIYLVPSRKKKLAYWTMLLIVCIFGCVAMCAPSFGGDTNWFWAGLALVSGSLLALAYVWFAYGSPQDGVTP